MTPHIRSLLKELRSSGLLGSESWQISNRRFGTTYRTHLQEFLTPGDGRRAQFTSTSRRSLESRKSFVTEFIKTEIKRDMQCTYNAALKRAGVIFVPTRLS